MNSPQQVIENFILWYTSDDTERDQLQKTIDDPAIYLHHDETLDDHDRISNNIQNVLTWVNRNWSKQDKTYLNLLQCVADYFQEDHVDGWESVEPEEPSDEVQACIDFYDNLAQTYKDEFKEMDELKFQVLQDMYERLKLDTVNEKTVKAFRGTFNWFAVKRECLIQGKKCDEMIPTTHLVDVLPICFKLKEKVFLLGDKEPYKFTRDEDEWGMYEFFDMTTEIKTGHSYSFYAQNYENFPLASDKERKEVLDFFKKLYA